MDVSTSTRHYVVAEREGVFVEIPFGLGASCEIVPRWVVLSLDITWGPNVAQSGSLFTPMQYTDSLGHVGHSPALPAVSSTFTQMLAVGVLL